MTTYKPKPTYSCVTIDTEEFKPARPKNERRYYTRKAHIPRPDCDKCYLRFYQSGKRERSIAGTRLWTARRILCDYHWVFKPKDTPFMDEMAQTLERAMAQLSKDMYGPR